MGILRHLWDDTVAGPPPDSGLGRLRKSSSFSPSSSSSSSSSTASAPPAALQVTRSITILRIGGPSSPSAASSPRSPPDSPASASTPRGDWKRLRRKSAPAEGGGSDAVEPRKPTVYDWVVISALDR
ncbi:dormancy-associated protein homolog 3-like [Curcuma longa]|uniref:dormancy-associated protein homolog 3-like n=1 Tax=Curcuma longa TaxID=136217 RepID=UPI003D9DCDCE